MFLSRTNHAEQFRLTQASAGLFEVLANNRLAPAINSSAPNPEFKDIELEEVTRKVQTVPGRK